MLCFSVTQFILPGTNKFVCAAIMIHGNSTIHVCSSMYVVWCDDQRHGMHIFIFESNHEPMRYVI